LERGRNIEWGLCPLSAGYSLLYEVCPLSLIPGGGGISHGISLRCREGGRVGKDTLEGAGVRQNHQPNANRNLLAVGLTEINGSAYNLI